MNSFTLIICSLLFSLLYVSTEILKNNNAKELYSNNEKKNHFMRDSFTPTHRAHNQFKSPIDDPDDPILEYDCRYECEQCFCYGEDECWENCLFCYSYCDDSYWHCPQQNCRCETGCAEDLLECLNCIGNQCYSHCSSNQSGQQCKRCFSEEITQCEEEYLYCIDCCR